MQSAIFASPGTQKISKNRGTVKAAQTKEETKCTFFHTASQEVETGVRIPKKQLIEERGAAMANSRANPQNTAAVTL